MSNRMDDVIALVDRVLDQNTCAQCHGKLQYDHMDEYCPACDANEYADTDQQHQDEAIRGEW